MSEAISIVSMRTEELGAATRASIIDLCIMAHQEEDFRHLFTYIPSGQYLRQGRGRSMKKGSDW